MANIVEIVMAITILILLLAANHSPLKSKADAVAIIFCLCVGVFVVWNCVSNFFLLKVMNGDKELFLPGSIPFWVRTSCFFLVCIFLILCLVVSYPYLEKENDSDEYGHYGMVVVMLWMLIIAGNGLYIFFKQLQLFFKAKNINKARDINLITKIGEQST